MTFKAVVAMGLVMLSTSGCVTDTFDLPAIGGDEVTPAASEPPEPAGPPMPDLSPRVSAALPDGIDPRFLMQGGDGCWVMVLEEREPANGVLLRDALGEPICE